MTALHVRPDAPLLSQGTYHQDGGVQPPSYLPPKVAAVTTLLGSAARTRLLHVLLRQEHPILTSSLAQESGVQYRVTLTHLQKLEEAGAVVADLSLDESRQGREIRWSANQTWLASALSDLTSYLTPPSSR